MLAVEELPDLVGVTSNTAPVVVVGTGPVGVRFTTELLARDPQQSVIIYGAEPWEPYNRVQLSNFLAGKMNWAELNSSAQLPETNRIETRFNCPITGIDRQAREVIDATGRRQRYSSLVLATGSEPHVPGIPGIDSPGVYTFRNMNDAQALLARRVRSRHTVIIGGGVLGLEAARAMQQQNTRVTLVEHSTRLMNRQLDDEASSILHEHVEAIGINLVLFDGVKRVVAREAVTAIELQSGKIIPCDTVVVVTGIRPNIALARDCSLSVGMGIRVDDSMRTSDPDIYAVGECTEHRGKIYGLVAPGYEQAAVAAHCMLDGKSEYSGSISATQLKVIDCNIFSMGDVGEEESPLASRTYVYQEPQQGIYRKLFLRHGRLIGAIAVGEWQGLGRLQEAITQKRIIWPWLRLRFTRIGEIWNEGDMDNVAIWPANTTVCNCNGVSRGTLSSAIEQGCGSISSLCEKTGAATVCGSCKPLLASLLGGMMKLEPAIAFRTLVTVAVISLATLLIFFSPITIPYLDTVHATVPWDELWRNNLVKQITGFSLLGLSLLVSLVSLRKRVKRVHWGQYGWWRAAHVVLAGLILLVLLAHTGFRMGHELNFWLMLLFSGLMLLGAAAGGIIGMEHKLSPRRAKVLRTQAVWLHILLFWPVPALLGFHVLKTYYY